MTRERGQWLIGRHFGVLACMAAALILFGRWRSMGPLAAFAVYGALHALAIVVSLRNPQPLSRKLRRRWRPPLPSRSPSLRSPLRSRRPWPLPNP